MPTLRRRDIDAVILDLDGVLTRTAKIHARAWKQAFDDYNRLREESGDVPFHPFDVESDYPRYVDGKPRRKGILSFLDSRGITLPEGAADDTLERGTVRGVANHKNGIYLEILDREGPSVYEDSVNQVRMWRARGLKTAVVSSSRNCARVLEAAGLSSLFDVRVDGVTGEELKLEGKPAPDFFLAAAERLNVEPARSLLVEDAVAGIRAGRRGGFGAVVGVDRTGDGERLREAGAHWVVKSLGEVKLDDSNAEATVQSAASPPSAFERWEGIARRLSENPVALFLDYDGTLTPIVSRPELAVLSDAMRAVLRKLAWLCPVAVVSGRDLRNVEALVGLKDLIYAGSHGFDISGPRGLRMELAEAKRALPELDAAEAELALRLEGVRGAWVERKRYSVAVHFRAVSEKDLPEIEEAVRAVLASREGLRKKGGKKVVELSPDLDWDKGAAVLWAIDALGLPPSVVPLYIGDDLTDEDAFKVLSDRGLGIFVGQPGLATHARYFLRDPGEVQIFLDRLAELLGG